MISALPLAQLTTLQQRNRAAVCTGVGAALATTAAVLAARHAALSQVSPVTPSGQWDAVWVAGVVAAVVLSIAGWLFAKSGPMRLRTALALAVAIQVIPLAAPLLLSKDVYLYWAVGRIAAVHHANPYVATLNDFPDDPMFPYPSESWRSYPAAHGPVWEGFVIAPAVIAGTSAHRAQLAYRILALLGILTTLAIVAVRTRSSSAVALLGWSPLVALHYAGGGHGDAWMMAFLVFAVGRSTVASGASWAVAGGFKPIPVILLPLELAGFRFRMGRQWWLGIIAGTLAIVAASTAAFGTHWFIGQARGIHRGTDYPTPLGGVHWLTQLGLRHGTAVVLAALVFAAIYAALFREAWRRGRVRLSLAASALCLTSTLIGPWYGLWALALAAVEEDEAAAVVALALTAYLLLADAVQF